VAERSADGLAGREEYEAARRAVRGMVRRDRRADPEAWSSHLGQSLLDFFGLRHLPGWCGIVPPRERFNYLSDEARREREAMRARGLAVITEEQAMETQKETDEFNDTHVRLLRDLFGPLPFRPVPPLERPVRAWNDGCILKLATSIYRERSLPEGHLDLQRLAVLADALEEAGVGDADILGHLRQQGAVHVRGCFVLDLLLGKS